MNKYIINNCPVFGTDYYCGEGFDKCATCTDCVMKQIYELCKFYRNMLAISTEDYARREVALKILDLLDIQEVE